MTQEMNKKLQAPQRMMSRMINTDDQKHEGFAAAHAANVDDADDEPPTIWQQTGGRDQPSNTPNDPQETFTTLATTPFPGVCQKTTKQLKKRQRFGLTTQFARRMP